jgi:hypothetical protein
MIYYIDSMISVRSGIKDVNGETRWVIARPIPDTSIFSRLKAAWWVFVGRAEAVRFYERPEDFRSTNR